MVMNNIFPYTIDDMTFNNQDELDTYLENLKNQLKTLNGVKKQVKSASSGPRKIRENAINMIVEHLNSNTDILTYLKSNLEEDARLVVSYSKESGVFLGRAPANRTRAQNPVGVRGYPVVIEGTQYDSKHSAIKSLLGVDSVPRKKTDQEKMLTDAGYKFTEVK